MNHDLLRAMEADCGRALAVLKVDGGAAVNDLLMQFQADVLGVAISRPAMVETTALGAAFLAGLAVGVWTSPSDITHAWREERRFVPRMDRPAVEEHLARWKTAIARA
jgi:glycerol kinase